MTNILFLITGLNTGGAEMQVYQVVKTLQARKQGYNPIIVSLLPIGPVGEKLQDEGFTVYTLGMERGKPSMAALTRLNRIIRKERIELIHSHMYHANVLGRLMKLFHPHVKLVNTIHNINIGGRNRERVLQATNRLADSITIISETARQHFVKVGAVKAERLLFMPNGVNTKLYQEQGSAREKIRTELGLENEFVWLAVGRFDEQKNYPNLLKSFAHVVEKNRRTKLMIAGIGPDLEAMQELAAKLGIADFVQFLGYRKDIPDLLNASDAYVMSSDWEGMPLVLQEASSVGLPIVCTDVGGNKEVVKHGKTGLIVQPKNPFSLSSGMLQLLGMPKDERKKLGQAGKRYMEEVFELEQVADRWHELYEEVLQHPVAIG